MKITRRQIRRIVRRTIYEGFNVSFEGVDATISRGDIILNNSRYELFVGLPFGVEGPKVTITDLEPAGDSVIVSGESKGKSLRKALNQKAIDVIKRNVGKREFLVPGKIVSVIFKRA